MKADAVLGCVAFAMLYEDWLQGPHDVDAPSFTQRGGKRSENVSVKIESDLRLERLKSLHELGSPAGRVLRFE